MTNIYTTARLALASLAIAAPGIMLGGNIPQYKVSKGGAVYAEFSDGTAIPCAFTTGKYALLPNGTTTSNAITTEGFPIGFDFKFGGRIVNQFIPSNTGDIYVGKDIVSYGNDLFHLSLSLIKNGLKSGKISYKVTGAEGDRVLNIQWKDATENMNTGYIGKYSAQIRLYEKDGRIEFALKELETVGTHSGFNVGLHGWNNRDAIQLTANGLDMPVTISPELKADILVPSSYIKWDADDYDNGYTPCFVLTPESDTTAPSEAPTDLTLAQEGTTLKITAKKGSNADATVILISEHPFTEADMPVDGETFDAGPTMKFGNATALYYDNEENIDVTAAGIKAGKTYYVRGMSVNGYPAYGRNNAVDKVFTSPQEAPSGLRADADGEASIAVTCEAQYPVIVAATSECLPGYQKGYVGVFAKPSADVKVGDRIRGGGTVVYVGDPGQFKVDVANNELTFLRAWTVEGETVSAESIDAFGIAAPSYPYEPKLENYPSGEQIEIWNATADQFTPLPRSYDSVSALRARSVENQEVILSSPQLPLDRTTRLTFEFAMETLAPPTTSEDSGDIALPSGNNPGDFGETGYLSIKCGDNVLKTVDSYSGTMVSGLGGGYSDGSSTFETVVVDLPVIGKGESITFAFATPESSTLYIRNIKIESTGEAPVEAPTEAPSNLMADEDRKAIISVSCRRATDAEMTAVLVNDKPFTEADMPQDGVELIPGQKVGNATVLYFGTDEDVNCATTSEILTPECDSDYYFRAIAANGSLLYNRDKVADFTYRTLPDIGAPSDIVATVNSGGYINVTATRHTNAAGSLILLSSDDFDGLNDLVDGTVYSPGDTVGNATVIYQGDAEKIDVTTSEAVPAGIYIVTGISVNSRGWFGDSTNSYRNAIVGVESIEADEIDFSTAEIYNMLGVKIQVRSFGDLPNGIYVINGKKITKY